MADIELADLLEDNKLELAQASAKTVIERGLAFYAAYNHEQLTQMLLPSVTMVARYFRSDNLDEYKEYINKVMTKRHAHGYSLDDVVECVGIVFVTMEQFVDAEIAASGDEKRRIRYTSRLQSVKSLNQVAIILAGVARQDVK